MPRQATIDDFLHPVNRSEGTATIEGAVAYRQLSGVPAPPDGGVVMLPHGIARRRFAA